MADYDEDNDQQERTDAEWAKLRRERKAKEQAEAEAAKAKRELAFLKAGLDPDDPKTSYFVKGYEGEDTPEAIRKAAVEAGFLAEPSPEPVDDTPVNTQDRITNASQGASEIDATEEDIIKAFNEGGMDALSAALRAQGVVVNDVQ